MGVETGNMKTSRELMKIFSWNARLCCKQKGMRIGDLERQVGVSPGYLSRIEYSRRVSLANICRTAEILGVTIDDLLSENMMIDMRIEELKKELKMLKSKRGEND